MTKGFCLQAKFIWCFSQRFYIGIYSCPLLFHFLCLKWTYSAFVLRVKFQYYCTDTDPSSSYLFYTSLHQFTKGYFYSRSFQKYSRTSEENSRTFQGYPTIFQFSMTFQGPCEPWSLPISILHRLFQCRYSNFRDMLQALLPFPATLPERPRELACRLCFCIH